jgi:hypothetical protein
LEIVLPPDIAESIVKITRERRVDAALLIMIKEYLELKVKDIERRIKNYEKKHGMDFESFREACKSGKLNTYSHEIEEDYREWEALLTLKRYYGELMNKWPIGA